MFLLVYQICVAIFLLQGILLPILVLGAGIAWYRQARRVESLRKKLRLEPAEPAAELPETLLAGLPKLAPLNCRHCGGAILLRDRDIICPSCQQTGELPPDYAAAMSLKAGAVGLLKRALANWRVANVVTHPVSRWSYRLMIFVEPLVLFPVVLIGSNVFPNAPVDHLFGRLNPTVGFVLMLAAFLGFVIWMVVFLFLAGLGASLRAKLPQVPRPDARVRQPEAASCQACGGAIAYDAGDFACLCRYCDVENYRAEFVGRERARAAKQGTKTRSALFGAMEIIDDFLGIFFITALFLVAAAVLLCLFYAVKNLLT